MGIKDQIDRLLAPRPDPEIERHAHEFLGDEPNAGKIIELYGDSARLREIIGRNDDGTYIEESTLVRRGQDGNIEIIKVTVEHSEGL